MTGWLAVPREWLSSLGEIAAFCGKTMGLVYSGRVFYFFGETLRQAGILPGQSSADDVLARLTAPKTDQLGQTLRIEQRDDSKTQDN